MDAQQEFMKVAEIVQELRIGRGRAYELLAADGTIPAVKIGRSVRVRRTLGTLSYSGMVGELTAVKDCTTVGGYFDDHKALPAEVRNVR
jgi:excisionase family DNA binding protein